MRAFVLGREGGGFRDVPDPQAAPGHAIVQTSAAGLCHSDLTLVSRAPGQHPFSLPVVLGHELAGVVVEVGAGAGEVQVGDPVVGYGPRGCGRCSRCSAGAENYCHGRATSFPLGLGSDGALAEFVAVPASHLVPAAGLPPAQAAVMTDAGLTALHALNRAFAMIGRPPLGLVVVVIGVGGLGHLAVRLAKLRGATVIAVDREEDARTLARRQGADQVLGGEGTAEEIRDLTHGRLADVVLDFVAHHSTLELARAVLARDGVVSIVGVGADRLAVGMHALPLGARTDLPFWGTRPELHQVLELARSGEVEAVVEELPFEQTPEAYRRLAEGDIRGRAVVRMRADDPARGR
ncbi:NAD(P)-dependent alcohol dehydrogenase [Aeromicrobium camelliae]|uniref:alcohol dehydrogenase n=1 Tax=Aeromicrobium camelliae TaxID=1538144 RepID=A0A3N6YGN0_9ACTN|nr:NAD(P)-dependent alcohol dehydrogenase [Aeromicrobium camelliae]